MVIPFNSGCTSISWHTEEKHELAQCDDRQSTLMHTELVMLHALTDISTHGLSHTLVCVLQIMAAPALLPQRKEAHVQSISSSASSTDGSINAILACTGKAGTLGSTSNHDGLTVEAAAIDDLQRPFHQTFNPLSTAGALYTPMSQLIASFLSVLPHFCAQVHTTRQSA